MAVRLRWLQLRQQGARCGQRSLLYGVPGSRRATGSFGRFSGQPVRRWNREEHCEASRTQAWQQHRAFVDLATMSKAFDGMTEYLALTRDILRAIATGRETWDAPIAAVESLYASAQFAEEHFMTVALAWLLYVTAPSGCAWSGFAVNEERRRYT